MLGGVVGASALVVDQLFTRPALERWLANGTPTALLEVAAAG